MANTRILHIIDSLPLGGAEKLLVGTINGLPDYDHHLIYLGGSGLLAKNLNRDCQISSLNYKTKIDIPRCVIEIRRYIKNNDIDIVHSHLILASFLAKMACPRKSKLFITLHSMVGSRFFGPGKSIARLAERITYKKRHQIIAVSEEVYKDYDHFVGIKGVYHILPNFVEDHFFQHGLKKMNFNGSLKMITVGSLKPAKNYPYLIEAFKKLTGNISLDIYGEGPLRKELEDQIRQYHLNIRLCGVSERVEELMQSYDVFVMSSIYEGHPLALLEAMACGMPAITSDIPVLQEATDHKGIYFDLKDIDDFVGKVKSLAAHEVNLDDYAAANFETAKRTAGKEKFLVRLREIYLL